MIITNYPMPTPIQSMTGYASHETTIHLNATTKDLAMSSGQAIEVIFEIRSLNSRYLDIHFRLPEELRHLEPAMRQAISTAFARGKIDVYASLHILNTSTNQINITQIKNLLELQDNILSLTPKAQPLSVAEILHLNKTPQRTPDLSNEMSTILASFNTALESLSKARITEGAALHQIILQHISQSHDLINELSTQLLNIQSRLLKELQQKAQQLCIQLQLKTPEDLDARIQNEVAHYLINNDIAEEISRLSLHLKSLEQLLNTGGAIGKKAEFLVQEINREANTLGAKVRIIEFNQTGISLKVKADQIREQLQNVQ